MAQVQVKVLPGPSGEVVKLNAGGQQLISGDFSGRDTTTIEIQPDSNVELSVEVDERVVMNGDQFAATKVSVADPGGERSFAKEREEAKKQVAEDEKKQKEEMDKKFKEFERREDQRLGRQQARQEDRQERADERRSALPGGQRPGSGAHVAGNVVGSKEVRTEPGGSATSKPSSEKK